ncbi:MULTISPECIES: hypothetical protein [Bradyrhizobium]|nr:MULTISPECIES: hypothetical protein [Bradyrhizobium]MBR0943652.1 hypothetical protein [Bradyrhizobium liaoningense]MDI2071989.1 hypothetical protein [Bradyrhizobium sp. Mp27]
MTKESAAYRSASQPSVNRIPPTMTTTATAQVLTRIAAGDLLGFLIARYLAIALLVGVAGLSHGSSKPVAGFIRRVIFSKNRYTLFRITR